MNTKDLVLYEKYRHKLMMNTIEVIKHSNLQDLKTLWGILVENGFARELKDDTVSIVSKYSLKRAREMNSGLNDTEMEVVSLVRSNDDVKGVYMVDGKIKDIDYTAEINEEE